MIKLPPITWTHNGRSLSVSLFVEGDRVVGMTPVTGAQPAPRIQVAKQMPRYLGDRVASGLNKLGVPTCNGCQQRREALNAMDMAVRKRLIG